MFDTTNSQGAEQASQGDLRERIGLTIPWAEPRAMLDLVERAEYVRVVEGEERPSRYGDKLKCKWGLDKPRRIVYN